MKNKKLLWFTFIFLGSMVFLTICAQPIHNAMLPKVRVEQPKKYNFPFIYVDENNVVHEAQQERLAVSVEMAEVGIFKLYQKEKNGTQRYYVEQVHFSPVEEHDGYLAIGDDLYEKDQIVVWSSVELQNGDEVCVR